MVKAFLEGDTETARKYQVDAIPLIKALFSEVNPIPVKAALKEIGFDCGEPRLPLVPMTEPKLEILKQELKNIEH